MVTPVTLGNSLGPSMGPESLFLRESGDGTDFACNTAMHSQTDIATHREGTGLLSPVIEFLFRHDPFRAMKPEHVEFAAKRMQLMFFANGEVLLGPGDGLAKKLFIVKQGRILRESLDHTGSPVGMAGDLLPGECFPLGALVGRRTVRSRYRAGEDAFCLALDRADFQHLLRVSPSFHAFCSQRLAGLLDRLQSQVQNQALPCLPPESALGTQLAQQMRVDTPICGPEVSLRDALERMRDQRADALVIADADARPLGVFTLHDLLDRVTLPGLSLDCSVASVMTPDPVGLPPGAIALEAATLMAEHRVNHLCVVERGRFKGLLREQDLFSARQLELVNLSLSIQRAEALEDLVRISRSARKLVGKALAQGAAAEQQLKIIASINDQLSQRVIKLCMEMQQQDVPEFDWLAFGSEGRREQTLFTDQDNGILFKPRRGMKPDTARELLTSLARQINEALDRCGFSLCPGNVMASNPACCLTPDEWRRTLARCIDESTPANMLRAITFFDLRVLHGREGPAEELRHWFLDATRKNSRFRRQLAENALRLRPALGWLGEFKLAQRDDPYQRTLDLKINGSTPVVDAARIQALALGHPATHTEDRLQACVEAGVLTQGEVAAWIKAYRFIQRLRLLRQQSRLEQEREADNHVDPDELDEMDRNSLKEAFRQIRKMQSRLALDYQL